MTDLNAIMECLVPEQLFGTDPKEARRIFLSLLKHIHPDLHNGDPQYVEATQKLNQLWATYGEAH